MNIDRNINQGDVAKSWVTFCLNQLERADDFKKDIDWGTELVKRLTIEEIIGALVAAEQYIKEQEEYDNHMERMMDNQN